MGSLAPALIVRNVVHGLHRSTLRASRSYRRRPNAVWIVCEDGTVSRGKDGTLPAFTKGVEVRPPLHKVEVVVGSVGVEGKVRGRVRVLNEHEGTWKQARPKLSIRVFAAVVDKLSR
ncbi:hypothetical protein NLJ89_g9110 [Agrocybe chaxingu]|uniref:Uncharacterized protein n=1 Tax=Agrocybe chaxingu TaxID=84603 RepID=A0A9W8JU13_9AGAR|nr:hypothetical protein NLJ89_g9110 [Agrocybe chaxingu]